MHLTDADGDTIVALFGHGLESDGRELPNAAARPTMLYFYGNSMSMANSLEEFRRFRRLGFNVMIPDYPGYGMSGGHASEHAFQACAQAAYDNLKDHTVPFSMSEQLAAARGGVVPIAVDSGHVDIFERGGDEMMQRLKAFVERCASERSK